MSPKAAGLAKKSGYTNVKVMLEGQPAWVKAGNPVYASNGFVEKGNIVLVDLRSTAKAEAARLPRAVSIPSSTLADRMDDIPVKAPVVLYSDNESEAIKAMKQMRKGGYKKVSLVYGNLDNWLKADGKNESGPVVTDINWVRKLGKGEISESDFMKAASGSASNAAILDVRTSDEVKSGTFKSAITIPLDEIANRTSELPKDKMIYIHCSTGARAEMAHKELKKNGFKSSFLVANVECEDNACEIEE